MSPQDGLGAQIVLCHQATRMTSGSALPLSFAFFLFLSIILTTGEIVSTHRVFSICFSCTRHAGNVAEHDSEQFELPDTSLELASFDVNVCDLTSRLTDFCESTGDRSTDTQGASCCRCCTCHSQASAAALGWPTDQSSGEQRS